MIFADQAWTRSERVAEHVKSHNSIKASFNKTLPEQAHSANSYAIVIGISKYQDSSLAYLSTAKRDAEAFTAWLHTKAGGQLIPENIELLTNENASLSQIIQAINTQAAKCLTGDQLILYFAGYTGSVFSSNQLSDDLLFYDTPVSLLQSGSHQLLKYFVQLTQKRKLNYYFVSINYEIGSSQSQINSSLKSGSQSELFNQQFNLLHRKMQDESQRNYKKTLNHHLLHALSGYADLNNNHQVSLRELGTYFRRNLISDETVPGKLSIAASSNKCSLSSGNQLEAQALLEEGSILFPSVFQSEESPRENRMIRALPEDIQRRYQDYIVALKIGRLMPPEDANAYQLYLELIQLDEFENLKSDLRRKLIVALQDETQQAINRYLQSDPEEIIRRKNQPEKYLKYPLYLDLSIQLMEGDHFMANILKAKRNYFEGLNIRQEAALKKDTSLMMLALNLQLKALELVKDAAFIHNELGIIYAWLNIEKLAWQHFELAVFYSPTWSLPYLGMSRLVKDGSPKALKYLRKAIKLNPENCIAYNNLAVYYLDHGHFDEAESALVQSIKLQPKYAESYYNFACLRSLQSDFENSLNLLERALQLGIKDRYLVENDPDLDSLRKTTRFKELMEKYLK